MHEVSLAESIIAMVEDERRKQDFGHVHTIRLHVGALGCVEPHALQFCFDAVARGTIADGALLDIEVIAGVGFCEQCDRAVAMAARYDACLLCGSTKLRIIAGRDLRLVDMEVD